MIECYECGGAKIIYDKSGENLIECYWCDGKGKMNEREVIEYNKAFRNAEIKGKEYAKIRHKN